MNLIERVNYLYALRENASSEVYAPNRERMYAECDEIAKELKAYGAAHDAALARNAELEQQAEAGAEITALLRATFRDIEDAHLAKIERLTADNALLTERNAKHAEQILEDIAEADVAQAEVERLTAEIEVMKSFQQVDWKQLLKDVYAIADAASNENVALRVKLAKAEAVVRAVKSAQRLPKTLAMLDALAAYEAADIHDEKEE
jgi:cell division septum initiation protein DivIVA